MIVAVTGGTGFIGRHLIARHCARGDQVRYLTRSPSRIPIAGAAAYIGDLADSTAVLQQFSRGVDILYHCAAELKLDSAMQRTNVFGTEKLIAAACGDIGRWVQLSSTGVYGRNVRGDVREDSPVKPENAYEISKFAADEVLRMASGRLNISSVIVRPSNVYGTDMPNQSLFQLIRMIDRRLFFFIGKPGATANYTHVENVVDAMVLCGTSSLPDNARTYIVSDHFQLEDLVRTICSALGKAPPQIRIPESLARAACGALGAIPGFPLSPSRIDALTACTNYRSERIKSELGFENRISMEAGICELVRHFRAL